MSAATLARFLSKRKAARASLRRDRLATSAKVHHVRFATPCGDHVMTNCGLWYLGQEAERRIVAGATSAKPPCKNCHREERAKP